MTRSFSEADTLRAGEALGGLLLSGDGVLLEGPMGAGKTVFARGVARGLQASERDVSSPSFALMNVYEGGRLTMLHLDLYRLDAADPYELGVHDLMEGAAAVVEWPDRLTDTSCFARVIRVAISPEGGSRTITILGV